MPEPDHHASGFGFLSSAACPIRRQPWFRGQQNLANGPALGVGQMQVVGRVFHPRENGPQALVHVVFHLLGEPVELGRVDEIAQR